jgi:hypothetical protein
MCNERDKIDKIRGVRAGDCHVEVRTEMKKLIIAGKTDLNQFCLRMGMELVPETLYSNKLTLLCARENYIESCRRESFKTYITHRHI